MLLERSPASLTVQDEDGETPLHMAARGDHLAIVDLFLKAGADPAVRNAAGNTPAQVRGS